VIALVGCLVAVAALIGTAAALKNSADAERETAQLASELEASKLALQASMAGDFDVDLGLLLAQRAAALPGGSGDNTDIRNALQTAVDKSPVVAVLRGHGPATDAVYSDDGEFIATHHDDGSVVVWNAVSNQELYQLAGVADGLAMDRKTLDFDPSGTKLAGITSDGSVAIWSLPPAEGDPVLVDPNPGGTWHLAFSPDGTRIAAAGTPGVVVIDSAGRPTSDFGTPVSEEVDGYEVEWTPDGEQLVVAGADGVVSALDSESGEYLRDILSYPSAALTLDISAAGPTIASSTRDVVVVTDFETGAEIYRLENQATVDVSFSTDASRLIVMDGYGTAAVVAPSAEVVKQWVSASGMSPLAVDVDPTNPGRAVVAGAAGAPAVWNVSAGHSDAESAIESLPDGGVVTASYDGSVYAWRPDLTPRAVVPASDDPIQDASVDAAGELVALARSSGAVEVWSLQTGGRVFSDSMGEGVSAFAVALSPDGQYVAGGDDTGQVLVWEVATGAEYADLDSHTDAVVSLEYGADQQQLVSASWDERAIVWDLDNGTPALDIALETGATVVAWNSPGTVIAVGGDDGSVQFFDASSGDRLQMGIEHVEPVTDLAFDASGERLVSGSDDHSVIIWDATTGSMLERVQRGDSPWRVAFSVDGRHVLVGDGSGVPNVVFLDIDQLLRVAEQRATREITTQECEFYLGNAECGTGTAV
jgi:WD40 repeat protein